MRTLTCAFVVLFSLSAQSVRAEGPSFNRDVRPILAKKCFPCHGPDEKNRAAKLRLDLREAAVKSAIVPGRASVSELMRRVEHPDPDERMPPAESHETLSADDKRTLRDWIDAGAEFEAHWAFVPPSKPKLPKITTANWARNGVDHFVLAKLEEEGLRPSAEANPYVLVRRLYLDLIGLPPSPAEADRFVNDRAPRAYERLVDRLLQSERYGERWARAWLDLARYSDTNGYEKDRPRSIWPYRDWVIRALNEDMPFDQFSIEQLAGDMLPNASMDQRVATGFHRNTMLNEEGGIDPLEYRFYAMADRVATTGVVWLGLTTGCAQCHSHKYDPISHSDYYQLMALLNNADEPDLSVKQPEIVEKREEIEKKIAVLEKGLEGELAADEREKAFDHWLEKQKVSVWQMLRPTRMETNLPKLELLDDDSIFSSGDITKRDVFRIRFELKGDRPVRALRLEAMADERLPAGGPGRCYYEGRKGDFFLSDLNATLNDEKVSFASGSRSYGKIAVGSGNGEAKNVFDNDGSTGWSTAHREGESHQIVLQFAKPVASGVFEIEMIFERHFAASLGRFRFAVTSDADAVAKEMPVDVERVLSRDRAQWTPAEEALARRYFVLTTPALSEARKKIDTLKKRVPEFPRTMVLEERAPDNPRKTFRHHRGEYLSPREEVQPAVPAVFPGLIEGSRADRLGLARWLVSDRNPLVGRVAVNRAWQAFFGAGLLRSGGDFGTQSEPPTHPELLDWLACEFAEKSWSMKSLHRLLVTSSTYRQSANVSEELIERDGENRLYARGPRYRLDAEVVRDLMLHASGVLSSKMYGPSVYPPQPSSVVAVAYGGNSWKVSKGEDRYRRSLYTFNKRTAPFAAFTVFDGPTGENCVTERNRSNTPLQALTLLNDAMFFELARALAKSSLKAKPEAEECATLIFRRLLTRPPEPQELAAILAYQKAQRARLDAKELQADAINGTEGSDAELASWVMLARSLMNTDEAITKP